MASEFKGLVVVIPTRNRAGLAMNAVRSVLDRQGASRDVRVMVTDNSTEAAESQALSEFCARREDERLRYVRPPAPLPMTEHWEWALAEALKHYDLDHFSYLTDRMVFRDGELPLLAGFARRYPEQIITYHHDRVVDYPPPVRVEQHPWTGKLLEVEALHLSRLHAEAELHPCLPRMLNCIVPRTVFERVRRRFGSVFASASPDYNFGYRALAVVASILYYEKSSIIHYALGRSNGASLARGQATRDHADFIANLGGEQRNSAAPIPALRTVGNAIFHEYGMVAREAGGERFFEVNREKYLAYIASEVEQMENEEVKAEMRAILSAHGWRARVSASSPQASTAAAANSTAATSTTANFTTVNSTAAPTPAQTGDGGGELLSVGAGQQPQGRSRLSLQRVRNIPRRIRNEAEHRLQSPAFRWLRRRRAKAFWLLAASAFRFSPPEDHQFVFDSAEEAIAFINRFPRRPYREFQEEFLQGRVLETPGVSDPQ